MSDVSQVGFGSQSPSIEEKFQNAVDQFTHELRTLEQSIATSESNKVEPELLRRLMEIVEDSVEACRLAEAECGADSRRLEELQRKFREATQPFFGQSWFANRARTKPSGFPGDYDMLCKVYGDVFEARGIGAYLDAMFIDLPLACAVRGRLDLSRDFLIQEASERFSRKGQAVRVLDIASGPCREYLNWPSISSPVDVLAMDSDVNAIAYVREQIAPKIAPPSRLECIQYNAFRTRSSEATIEKFGRFDILYSVGLCDYLTDDVLVRLLEAWDNTLTDDGVMFIAFKDTRRYDQTIYQWHLDWFFYQRTVQDVFELYDKAGFDLGNIETCRDASGVITGFVTRRDPSRMRRTDASHSGVRRPTLRLFSQPPMVVGSTSTAAGVPAT